MKRQPAYRCPWQSCFEPITRREAAQLIRQWRRYGNASVRRMVASDRCGYIFHDWFSSTAAEMVLR